MTIEETDINFPLVNKHSNGKQPFFIGDTSSNGGFRIAMLVYRSVVRIVKTTTEQKQQGPFLYSQCLSLSFSNIFDYQQQTITKKNTISTIPNSDAIIQKNQSTSEKSLTLPKANSTFAPSNQWLVRMIHFLSRLGGKLLRQGKTP